MASAISAKAKFFFSSLATTSVSFSASELRPEQKADEGWVGPSSMAVDWKYRRVGLWWVPHDCLHMGHVGLFPLGQYSNHCWRLQKKKKNIGFNNLEFYFYFGKIKDTKELALSLHIINKCQLEFGFWIPLNKFW